MGWPEDSIAVQRGVSRGAVGTTHELSEERQGTFHFTMGPYSSPVLEIHRATGSSWRPATRSVA